MPLLFDGHLDLAWNALSFDRDLTLPVDEMNTREGHMTDSRSRGNTTVGLPELWRGGVRVCLATVLAHARPDLIPAEGAKRISLEHGSLHAAHCMAQGQASYYWLLEKEGHLKQIRSREDLTRFWQEAALQAKPEAAKNGRVGFILAMEGADAIIGPQHCEEWFAQGLRSVNLVHYGHNQYAVGTGDSGPLTSLGVDLLQEFERLGIILDTTHLCDESFFQALDVFNGPVIASHNNCRTLVPGERQFSNEQLGILLERDAIIGVCFDNWMLAADWCTERSQRTEVTFSNVADHIDHICQLAGSHRNVAIGSDLDGGFGTEQSPSGLETIADVQKLADELELRHYSNAAISDIFHGNWIRFFTNHLPTTAN